MEILSKPQFVCSKIKNNLTLFGILLTCQFGHLLLWVELTKCCWKVSMHVVFCAPVKVLQIYTCIYIYSFFNVILFIKFQLFNERMEFPQLVSFLHWGPVYFLRFCRDPRRDQHSFWAHFLRKSPALSTFKHLNTQPT